MKPTIWDQLFEHTIIIIFIMILQKQTTKFVYNYRAVKKSHLDSADEESYINILNKDNLTQQAQLRL